MKKITTLCAAISALSLSTGFANSEAHAPVLSIDGVVIATSAPAPDFMDIDEVISGWVYRTVETQALQMDDFDNPGMIFVDQALDDWVEVNGSEGKSCVSCHTGGPEEFAGLRTVLPRWNEDAGAVWTMEDYINNSLVEHMGAEPW
ncbi:MAG: sulfur oxidation c-type cytochrome SoxA, partial [Rhodobacteraceae bacterium]|nr:sulfur oxidation c-type cytochrome SoxA [Paracoccaceae bacterium]